MIEARLENNQNVSDIRFCPRELIAGDVNEYIADAEEMLAAFDAGRTLDITNEKL